MARGRALSRFATWTREHDNMSHQWTDDQTASRPSAVPAVTCATEDRPCMLEGWGYSLAIISRRRVTSGYPWWG